MGFRLVPKWVTLNDFERRNGHYFCVISPNSVTFVANLVAIKYTKHDGRAVLFAVAELLVLFIVPFDVLRR